MPPRTPTKRKEPMTDADSPKSPSHAKLPEEGEGGDGFTKVLTKEEKRKQRKVDRHRPQFQFDTSYYRNGKKIGIAHIRDLVLYIVADAQKPGWIVPENKAQISHTVVLFIPGLLLEHLGLAPIPIAATFPFSTVPPLDAASPPRVPIVAQMFSYGCPTRAPGDQRRLFSVMATLLQSPLPEGVRKKREAEGRKLAALAKSDSSPFLYLLTPNQMIDNDYRLPSYISPSDSLTIPGVDRSGLSPEMQAVLDVTATLRSGAAQIPLVTGESTNGELDRRTEIVRADEGWVETPEATGPPSEGFYRILAMDCEMVMTARGQELARVSVVDHQSGVNIFDQLVKPSRPVTDYLTKWSGITPEQLQTATHTLATIQDALIFDPSPIITPHTILLGHSLECDLAALRIRHPLCIDTALIYKHPRGPPYKPGLKWLTQRWLGREIQGSEQGHDSEEDARACVDLLKMKMANGPDFGTFLETTESIFERMNRFTPDPTVSGKSSAICDHGTPSSGHGSRATTVVKCRTDDEVISAMCDNVPKHDFVFGRLMELADVQGWNGEPKHSSPLPSVADGPTTPPPDGGVIEIDAVLASLHSRLASLHAALPANTAFILLTGHASPLRMLELSAKRQKWERLVKTLGSPEGVPKEERWLAENDRELEEAAGAAREGMTFFCVKGREKETKEKETNETKETQGGLREGS